MSEHEFVDLRFPVRGRTLPADHAYPLYGAISRAVPALHSAAWLMIHPIHGERSLGARIHVRSWSAIVLRLPATHIPVALALSGVLLTVADSSLAVGVPQVVGLAAARSVAANKAVVRLTRPPRPQAALDKAAMAEAVHAELARQLAKLGVKGSITLGGKRELRVGDQRILGWAVRVDGLSEPDSIVLQSHGLGGKHRMGCGVFLPVHRP